MAWKFIDFAPIPNYFGFGPGKFDWAVKTFSFLLRDNNEVRCDMDFVAGARAGVLHVHGDGELAFGGKLPGGEAQIGILEVGVAQAVAKGEERRAAHEHVGEA